MKGVLAGFVTIGAVIGLGILLAHIRILDEASQRMLVRLAFFVASPALMITVLGEADISRIFSATLVASVSSVFVAASAYLLLARLVWRRTAGETVIGTFASAYVNAGNLGLPIAAYVLGDASLIAPMLLTQLLVLQPVGLALLDLLTSRGRAFTTGRQQVLRILSRIVRNPLTIGSLLGLLLSISGLRLPPVIADPLHLVGGMAVPAMLLAYGVSLRLGPLPGAGEPPVQVATIVALKLLLQPACAYAVAKLLGLEGLDVLAVTVIAALPTAQNVFTHAVRYNTGVILARDTIFISTLASVPVLIVIAGLLT
ncbi:MAG: putative family transporter [Propionibacteriaceae bacterium]|nr:putative family transporter [Propionibacteriaceae bacterium]